MAVSRVSFSNGIKTFYFIRHGLSTRTSETGKQTFGFQISTTGLKYELILWFHSRSGLQNEDQAKDWATEEKGV
jgi:hypothetical protein